MEGGYVNEGGQLKTKNGQKYVFNGPPSGVFVSKTCATFSVLIVILILISSILITYFTTRNTINCINVHTNPNDFQDTNVVRLNATPVATASMLSVPMPPKSKYNPETLPAPVGDIPIEHDLFSEDKTKLVDRKLHLYDGWSPLQYKNCLI